MSVKIKIKEEWFNPITGKYVCPYCNKEYCKKGIGTHIWRNHGEGKNWNNNNKNRVAWNKGLTKETDLRVKKNGENVSKTLRDQVSKGTFKPTIISEEQKREFSLRMSKYNPGGKCKWYMVNGICVQGTWERDFANILNENNIRWERCNFTFKYHMDNKLRRYTPDFYLPDYDLIIEIKGYWWGSDKEKTKNVIKENKSLRKRLKIIRSYDKLEHFVEDLK